MLGNDTPERTGIGCPDRLALIHNCRTAIQQRRINNIGMSYHPANIGGRPENFPGFNVINVLHGPLQGNGVPAIVPHDAFGLAGCSRCIKNVERIGCCNGHTGNGLRCFHQFLPVQVTAGNQIGLHLRTLIDNSLLRFMGGNVDGFVHKRFVCQRFFPFDAAGGGYDDFRLGIVNADSQLIGGKTAENNRMHGTDTGAGQHRHHGLRDHRHINDHRIAFCDA